MELSRTNTADSAHYSNWSGSEMLRDAPGTNDLENGEHTYMNIQDLLEQVISL